MSECCSTSCQAPTANHRTNCPGCSAECREVSISTILHHLLHPWTCTLQGGPFYFCSSPECELVYFSAGGERIDKGQLREPVGQKRADEDRLLCYCFGVRLRDYRADPGVRDFVVTQTKAGICACESRNPSGRCCLADFPPSPPGHGG